MGRLSADSSDPGDPPKRGSLWTLDGRQDVHWQVVSVDLLAGTAGRFLVSIQSEGAPNPPTHLSDKQFKARCRRIWSRYDMITSDEILDEDPVLPFDSQ